MVLNTYKIYKATCIESAEHILNNEKIDLIILDVWLGTGITGLDFLEKIRSTLGVPVLVMSGHGSIDLAIRAVKLGAEDFLEKPFSGDKLMILVDRVINHHLKLKQAKLLPVPKYFFIGSSDKWKHFHKKLEKLDSKKIILSGQLGVGKSEAVTFLLQRLDSLNEIFYLSENDLDKIKTLKKNDAAIIHVQNAALINNIHGDCYIFIKTRNKIGLEVPSLMQREDDIIELFEYFLNEMRHRLLIDFMHDITLDDLKRYAWPGNIIELESIVRQLAVDSLESEVINRNSLLEKIHATDLYSYDIKKAKSIFEKQYLLVNLKRCNQNIARMARLIGMERSALYRKMKKDIPDSNDILEEVIE